jgi:hypothetical protein
MNGGLVFEGGVAISYDHGYDAEVFHVGLALDPKYVEGFFEGAWRGSERTTRRMKLFSGIFGSTRVRGRRCLRYCRPTARCCQVDPRTTFLLSPKPQASLQKLY